MRKKILKGATKVDPPLLCHCGKSMYLKKGSETRLVLVCSCGEYFYAASRYLTAIREGLPQDLERALDIVLAKGEGWHYDHNLLGDMAP